MALPTRPLGGVGSQGEGGKSVVGDGGGIILIHFQWSMQMFLVLIGN